MVKYLQTFILQVNDVSVLVHAEDFRLVNVGQLLYVVFEFIHVLMLRTVVSITFAELVILLCHDIVVLEDLQNIHQEQPVEIVGNSTTVIDLAGHKLHGIPRDFFVLGQEVFDHRDRCAQVSITKFVSNVPAQRSKLAAFLDNCVEESKSKKQIAKFIALCLQKVSVWDAHNQGLGIPI